MIRTRVPLARIQPVRRRKHLGDLDALAKSMHEHGLLHELVVTNDCRLVSGERRLAAARLLGWDRITIAMVDDVLDAVALVNAERDGAEHLPMLPSEMAHLGLAIEGVDSEEARRERKRYAGKRGGLYAQAHQRGERQPDPKILAELPRKTGALRKIIGPALGIGETTYGRVKYVAQAAADESRPARQLIAQQALAVMDDSGVIAYGFNLLRRYETEDDDNRVQVNALIGPAAPVLIPAPTLAEQRRALDQAELALSGIRLGLAQIIAHNLDPGIEPAEAAQWVDGLAKSRRELDRLIRRLRVRATERDRT